MLAAVSLPSFTMLGSAVKHILSAAQVAYADDEVDLPVADASHAKKQAFIANEICYEIESVNGTSCATIIGLSNEIALTTLANLIIPQRVTYNGQICRVTTIGENAFKDKTVGRVLVPRCISTIEKGAFSKCNLQEVTFEDGSDLTTICQDVFSGSSISTIRVPRSVKTIDKSAFSNCVALRDLRFECDSQLEQIGDGAFSGCTGLEAIRIPRGVRAINQQVFYDCSGLESLEFEEGSQLTEIGTHAFYGCTGLKAIQIPRGVRAINHCAFCRCSGLESLEFEDGSQLEVIKECVFNGCTGLKAIRIPRGVRAINQYAFCDCCGLESLEFEAGSQRSEERRGG
jgi:hypothetical protein